MSLIYQALRQLHNDAETHDGEAPPAAPVSSSVPETPLAPSRRKWWVIAVALVLVLAGLGAVWGTRHLTDRLQTDAAPSSAAARNAVQAPSSPAVQPVPQAPAPKVAPIADAAYFPPDASPAGASSPIQVPSGAPHSAPMSSTAAIVTEVNHNPTAQGADQPGAQHDQAEAVPAMPTTDSAEDQVDERFSAVSASTDTTEGRPEHDSALTAASPPTGAERVARTNRTPPQWSAEQARLERVRRAARARSSRIHRLVADLETAVAQNPDDEGRIRALLNQLAQTQGADDPYVVKMRAYWRFRRGDLEAARTLFQQVTDADGSDLEAGINLALIEARTGERRQALARLNQLRRAHPDNLQVAELLRRLN